MKEPSLRPGCACCKCKPSASLGSSVSSPVRVQIPRYLSGSDFCTPTLVRMVMSVHHSQFVLSRASTDSDNFKNFWSWVCILFANEQAAGAGRKKKRKGPYTPGCRLHFSETRKTPQIRLPFCFVFCQVMTLLRRQAVYLLYSSQNNKRLLTRDNEGTMSGDRLDFRPQT